MTLSFEEILQREGCANLVICCEFLDCKNSVVSEICVADEANAREGLEHSQTYGLLTSFLTKTRIKINPLR